MSCALWSCDELPGTGGTGGTNDTIPNGPNGPQVTELLSPLEAKQKMESVGLKFVDAIEADAHRNVVDVMEYFASTFGDFDIDEAYEDKLESLVYTEGYDEDYATPMRAMLGLMAASLDAAQHGAKLSETIADVWVYSLKAGFPDVCGAFTPDYVNEVWTYDPSVNDRVEMSFTDDNDQRWVAAIKGSKETTRVKVNVKYEGDFENIYEGGPDAGTVNRVYDDSYEFVIDVPKELTFTVMCDNNTILNLAVNSSLAFDIDYKREATGSDSYEWQEWVEEYWHEWYDEERGEWVGEWVTESYGGYYGWNGYEREYTYTIDVDYSNLNLAASLKLNNYDEAFAVEVSKTGTTMSTELKIEGRSILKASGHVNADVDALIADAEDEEFKARNVKDIKMNFDLLGEVQVIAECKNFKNLYDAFSLYDEAQDAGNESLFYNRVKDLNGAYSIRVCYDGYNATQAIIELEGYEEEDEWDGEKYFNVRPIIKFLADESTYAIEDYFTETAFSELIDAIEDLAEEFDDMYGDYFEEDVVYPDYGEDYHK